MKNTYPYNDRLNPQKVKSKKEIAEEMGISISTLKRRLKTAGIFVPRGLIFPGKWMEIYERLGR